MKEHVVVPKNEITFAMIKPDAVRAGCVGEIITIMERNFAIADLARVMLHDGAFAALYSQHAGKSFFPSLCLFMASGPLYLVTLEGENAVEKWRQLIGATDPKKAAPETIRGRFGSKDGPMMHNAVHGSDSQASANSEFQWAHGHVPGGFGPCAYD